MNHESWSTSLKSCKWQRQRQKIQFKSLNRYRVQQTIMCYIVSDYVVKNDTTSVPTNNQ